MRVCWFADARSPHLRSLARALSRLGVSIHIVSHKPATVPHATVERFRVPPPGLTNPRRWTGRHRHYLRSVLRRFDLVNVHFLEDWGFTPELLAETCFVATAWGSDIVTPPAENRPTPELIAARKAMLGHASAVTACGLTFARVVSEFASLPLERVEVVPFGVDLDLFRPISSNRGEGAMPTPFPRGPRDMPRTDGVCVGFLKGFRAVYGPDVLIRAIPHVLQRHPTVRFELVGDGPFLADCQVLARSLGLTDSIRWLGRVPHDQVPSILSRWSVSVIPSRCEAFGVAALESSAMKVPVVASDVCGLRDTVRHRETGLLVPIEDEIALADATTKLLSDALLRQTLQSNGRAMVEREYGLENVARQWLGLYKRARERTTCMV